ncbi:hypothetical protein [Deinococcus geothermalis]|nr:hypothetical protein [Deinococcus geothermalis]
MTAPAAAEAVHAMLTHPTDAALRGPVTFRLPDAYTAIAIQRRIVELANAGRDQALPRLHPLDLPPQGYQLCVMIATLEHVINTAPKGLYRTVNGRAVLTPGALVDFEAEETDGAISLLYAAYEEWRSRFRERRAGPPAQPDAAPGSPDDRPRGAAGGAGPAESAGGAG